jgi:hypothetical protein
VVVVLAFGLNDFLAEIESAIGCATPTRRR